KRLNNIALADFNWAMSSGGDKFVAVQDEANLRKALEDYIADKADDMQKNIDAAYKTRAYHDADTVWDFDKTQITYEQYQTDLDSHKATYDTAVVSEERNYAQLVANQRKTKQDAILDREQQGQSGVAGEDTIRAQQYGIVEKNYADDVAKAEKDYA